MSPLSAEERTRRSLARSARLFWARVEKTDDCWLWTDHLNYKGYGQLTFQNRTKTAHRVSYELTRGPVPAGLELDHLCRIRACVNPEHLEPVTHQENMKRGHWARKTHCPQGHEYTPENTKASTGGRRLCRTCQNAAQRRRRAVRREQGLAA